MSFEIPSSTRSHLFDKLFSDFFHLLMRQMQRALRNFSLYKSRLFRMQNTQRAQRAYFFLPSPLLLPPIYLPSASGADFAIINRTYTRGTYMVYFPALFLRGVTARCVLHSISGPILRTCVTRIRTCTRVPDASSPRGCTRIYAARKLHAQLLLFPILTNRTFFTQRNYPRKFILETKMRCL